MTPATKALPTKVKCEFESVLNLLSYYTYKQEHVPIFFAPALARFFLSILTTCPLLSPPASLLARNARCAQARGESLCTGSQLDSTA